MQPVSTKTHSLRKAQGIAPKAPVATPDVAKPHQSSRSPVAGVVNAVGGRAVGSGALQLVRLPGRDVDVLMPATGSDASATFKSWVDGLERSGAFGEQAKEISALAAMTASTGGSSAPDPRPTIGIVISEPRMLVKGTHPNTENIIALVEAMGCRPVLIPPCADLVVHGGPTARARAIAALASSLDGLVGPGGADVDPSIYGAKNTASIKTNVMRDRFEADFVKTALDCDLFGFGICRSHQLWNAAAGGSLIQDVQSEGAVSLSHNQMQHGIPVDQPMVVRGADGKVLFEDRIHLKKRSMIFEATRQQSFAVNSLHHQAVSQPGWGFRVVGRVHDDVTKRSNVEATERWNGITVQYHPELLQKDEAQRELFGTVGRRAYAFSLLKELKKLGIGTLPVLLDRMKKDDRYNASDLAWAKRELGRRL